ncbi:MAG TPA: SMC-Scp complex subunit ScpB [Chitinophagaceae bacterium]|nr:SMC-Scp complex subunit ScpB [Chitinophagaceae bacterium]
MEISNLILHIEALIFASEKPLTSMDVVELVNNAFGFMEDKITLDQVEASIDGIREKYASEFYPFELRQSGGGWQFLTKRDFHKTIAQLNGDKFLKRLSTAALETLAIIAYKQPITKGDIEAIRGVNSDYSIQKLLEKELIVITGRNEQLPGKPLVYATSRHFMDYFGINSADDLPRINEVLADQIVAPTLVNADHFDVEEGAVLAVSEDGELIAKAIEEGAEDEIIEIEMVEEAEEQDDPTEVGDEVADDPEDESFDENAEAADESTDGGSGNDSEDNAEESTSGDDDDDKPRS